VRLALDYYAANRRTLFEAAAPERKESP